MYRHSDVFLFRFLDTLEHSSFYKLFAVGKQTVIGHNYNWDGLTRNDGELFLFQYTLSGQGQINTENKSYHVNAGDAFMVEIPSNHSYYLPKTSNHWEFIFILMEQSNLIEYWQEIVGRLGTLIKMEPTCSAILFLESIIHSAGKNDITDGYRASSIVYQFVMEFYRFSHSLKKDKKALPECIIKARKNMDKHYSEIQSLEDIAEAVGLSKYYFTRLFSKSTGYTPIEYLTKIRMEKAVDLLINTDLTVDDIAKLIGYSNGSYFIKVFRQWIGYPPGEFRSRRDLLSFANFKFD